MDSRNHTSTRHSGRLLAVVVAVLLLANQSAFRMGVPAAVGATTVACCGCPPGHCHCGHAHKALARCCTRTGGPCLCATAAGHHENAGLVHADWPPTLRARVRPPVVALVDGRPATAAPSLTGRGDPPPLPPPQVG